MSAPGGNFAQCARLYAAVTETLNRADEALLRLVRAVQATGYAFTAVTPATHARVNARPEDGWARDLRGIFGWSRPFRVETVPAHILELMRAASVIVPHGDGWRSTIRIATLDGMAFLHGAYPTIEPDSVFFGPDTYRFTAALTAWLDRGRPVRRAVDVGCGAGPGGIVVARARPAADILMVDINDRALRFARINALLAGVAVHTARSDLLRGTDGQFDLVIANPPFMVDPAMRAYRHGGGALGEGLGLAILDAALDRLTPGGTLALYTGVAICDGRDAFLAEAAQRLAAMQWTYRELDPDVFGEELEQGVYARADRIAAVLLIATK